MWTGLEMKVMKKGANATKIVDAAFLINFTALFTWPTKRSDFLLRQYVLFSDKGSRQSRVGLGKNSGWVVGLMNKTILGEIQWFGISAADPCRSGSIWFR